MATVNLIKHDAVDLGNGYTLYIMNYYLKGMFFRCSLKVDSKENWKNAIERLKMDNPAEFFTLRDIGFEEEGDYNVIYSQGRTMTRMMAYTLLTLKFSEKRIRTTSDFVNEEYYLKGNVTRPYIRKYKNGPDSFDILDMLEIPRGRWFTEEYERCNGKHRKSRVIM